MNAMPVSYVAIRNGVVRRNKGEDAMPDKVKSVIVDLSTFFDKSVPAYVWPGQVTLNEREPIDRSDDGPWGGEVRV